LKATFDILLIAAAGISATESWQDASPWVSNNHESEISTGGL